MHEFFRRFSGHSLRYALFVYRLIGAALIEIFFDDPFLIQNQNFSTAIHIWDKRHLRVNVVTWKICLKIVTICQVGTYAARGHNMLSDMVEIIIMFNLNPPNYDFNLKSWPQTVIEHRIHHRDSKKAPPSCPIQLLGSAYTRWRVWNRKNQHVRSDNHREALTL